jgi:pimeloyl-ACP methyl ester carboxylesterase
MYRIESILSARLFIQPHLEGKWIYFQSNLSGHISLYRMKIGGSVPQPLIPPEIAMHNPHLIDGYPFVVLPKIQKIVVMLDQDGDEKYQPMLIPMTGGYPEPMLEEVFKDYRCHLVESDSKKNILYFGNESLEKPETAAFRVELDENKVTELSRSNGFVFPACHTKNHNMVVLVESFSMGDSILSIWGSEYDKPRILMGTPMEARTKGKKVELTGISGVTFSGDEKGLLISSAIFSDAYSVGYLPLRSEKKLQEVKIKGLTHSGLGELEGISELADDHYSLLYNIDGSSWLYQAKWDPKKLTLKVEKTLCGMKPLKDGKLESFSYDKKKDRFVLSFSTARNPTQIYLRSENGKDGLEPQTDEQVLGISDEYLSAGEDASFDSYDKARISASLYLPSPHLSFTGPRPLIYYIHGGPQGQERPDFAWFSMPLIQFLTLKGFAVFVPNVRGSTGYGLKYTKLVDRDWGGNDRLDHVHAMKVLANDPRIDVKRAGVVGRSYGGYMSLTLAGRHPKLWKAAVDMFGPYDLLTFLERIPESWKPVMKDSLGDPVEDREFLIERSPKTHLGNMTCPLLVIQGRHDPRVVAQESIDLVEALKSKGKNVDIIVFEDEGHDVLKFQNRMKCYEAITDFFIEKLKPGKNK